MKILLAVLVGLWAFNVQATELVLKEGDVIDLGAAPVGQRVFEFDKVRMASHSLILVPASYRNVDIRINELTTDGIAYLYVYNDSVPGMAPPSPGWPQAGMCNPGQNGVKGSTGRHGIDGPQMTLTIGLAKVERFLLINHGGGGGTGGVGGRGQDGGGPGGANKCLNPCNGGNAGHGGEGGNGGDGGAGGDVVFKFSGDAGQVASDTFDDPYGVAFLHSLVGAPLRVKQIDGYPRPAIGLNILEAMLGEMMASESRVEPGKEHKTTSMETLTKPGVSFSLSGGIGGAPGIGGDGGKGGDGFRCFVGHDMNTGNNGENRNWMIGKQGRVGSSGKLTVLKLN